MTSAVAAASAAEGTSAAASEAPATGLSACPPSACRSTRPPSACRSACSSAGPPSALRPPDGPRRTARAAPGARRPAPDDDHGREADRQAEGGLDAERLTEHEGAPHGRDRGHEEHEGVDLGDAGPAQDQPVQAVAAEGRQDHQPGGRQPERGTGRRCRRPEAQGQSGEEDGTGRTVDRQGDAGRDRHPCAALQEGGRHQRQHAEKRDEIRPPGHLRARRPGVGDRHGGHARQPQPQSEPLPARDVLAQQGTGERAGDEWLDAVDEGGGAAGDAQFDGVVDAEQIAALRQGADGDLPAGVPRCQAPPGGPGDGRRGDQGHGERQEAPHQEGGCGRGLSTELGADEAGAPAQNEGGREQDVHVDPIQSRQIGLLV